MTIQKAMDNIEEILCSAVRSDNSIAYQLDTDDCDWIEMAKSALEKQIPKKPIEARRWLYDNGLICPVCSCSIYKLSFSYCPNCGQKIDWEE